MDAAEFHKMHRRTAAGARENFLKDGHLAGVVLLYDVEGNQSVAMLTDPSTPVAEAQRTYEESGVLLVLGHWRDFLPQLKWFAESRNAVAATLINEIWVATNQYAQDVLASDIRVSEHPMKDEAIAVISAWPQEGYNAMALDKIVRQRNGSGYHLERMSPELSGADLAGWLLYILPGGPDNVFGDSAEPGPPSSN